MFKAWCSSISSQFHVSWEQLEIIVLLGLSVAFGYLLLRILDVILFGQMAVNHHYFSEEGGDQSSYDYVHIRHNTHDIISEEEEISNADKDFHFNMPQHVREEQEDNLETIIGSTSSYPTRVANNDDVPSYLSSNTIGLRKRNPLQAESAANREISVVEGEEGYILVSKK